MTKSRKQIWSWALYDFGNSSFAVIIVAFVFAVYFKKVVAQDLPIGDWYWSLAISISMTIVAILNPILGAAADNRSNKKSFLLFFTLLSVVATSLLYFATEGMILYAMFVFIIANIGFQVGLGFYDAFLPEISDEKDFNKISSFGYAVGYAGSLISVLLVLPLKDEPRITFLVSAIIFLIFSLPLFFFLVETRHGVSLQQQKENIFRIGFHRVKTTFQNVSQYRNLKNFLLSFFIYSDGVNTIIFFSGIYAQSTLKFSMEELAYFFILVQFTALVGSLLFGKLADKFGTKKTLSFNLFSWLCICVSMYFIQEKNTFFIIGGVAGMFLGSTQAISRSIMSSLTPNEKRAEFFGFYGLFDKTSTILGPLAFGAISYFSGSERFAALSLGIFFIVGVFLLQKVNLSPKI
ncbi:MAG: MFS transporter [Ignavibacteriales bacterium]|nr:MFS transporter [Ignavibacteriales bacterium]